MKVILMESFAAFLFVTPIFSFRTMRRLSHTALVKKIRPPAAAGPLTFPFDELAARIGGSGKAKIIWEMLREGKNPLLAPESHGLSEKARSKLDEVLNGAELIPVKVVNEVLSDCGTRKFLQTLQDGQSIESVLIPSTKFDRTTLCVSTQVGCDRRCAFCLTGTMGLIRNLTADEIVGQVVNGIEISSRYSMPKLTNIVFMGMGDAGRNTAEVGLAVAALTDRHRMGMAQSKITISTVGPSPDVFMTLAQMPGTLAWSLHSPDDAIRKLLVPSTRHSTIELRTGLMNALASRESIRTRTIMIALTLIEGINDSLTDAEKLAEFIRPMFAVAPKIAIDLIPYNDINAHGFRRPNREQVNSFQRYMRDNGFFCSVRVTRGDDEFSACGMLATKPLRRARGAMPTSTSTPAIAAVTLEG